MIQPIQEERFEYIVSLMNFDTLHTTKKNFAGYQVGLVSVDFIAYNPAGTSAII
jgi:hypothetical protein